jgi:hypothetical protein
MVRNLEGVEMPASSYIIIIHLFKPFIPLWHVGDLVGAFRGRFVGNLVGENVGKLVGTFDGLDVGVLVGTFVGVGAPSSSRSQSGGKDLSDSRPCRISLFPSFAGSTTLPGT